jgi:hypothetical protein
MIKSMFMRWAGHATSMGEKRNSHRVFLCESQKKIDY